MIKCCKFALKLAHGGHKHIIIAQFCITLSGSLKENGKDFMLKNSILLSGLALILAACGGGSPKQVTTAIPPMAGAWQHLGATNNGNILISYDTASVRKNGDFMLLRDRKIVINPALEKYENTLRYKVAVNDWEFHCRNQSYRLAATQFLDDNGRVLLAQRFTPVEIRPMPISAGSISQKQYALICR